jgi:hypothetical protein
MADDLRRRNADHEAGHAVAALTFGIPIVKVTIDEDPPYMHRGKYDDRPDFAVEVIVVLCLAGGEAERLFCGSITDDADRTRSALSAIFRRFAVGPARYRDGRSGFRDRGLPVQ